MEDNSKNKFGYGILAFVLLVLAGFGISFLSKEDDVDISSKNSSDSSKTTIPKTDSSGGQTEKTPVVKTNAYKDGTYFADGIYDTPEGSEKIGVTLVLKNSVVVDAKVLNEARDGASKKFQDAFISGFKQYVVGVSVNKVNLDVVSGSSLTPKGFMDALFQIKNSAKI